MGPPIRRLLVLDDSASIRTYLKLLLEKGGFEAAFASTTEEAFALIRVKEFDGYLIDCNLGENDPCRDGLEAAVRLRALIPRPTIIMSGAESTQAISAAISRREIVAYLPKPFNLDQLMSRLNSNRSS